jgi:hypothetical protein
MPSSDPTLVCLRPPPVCSPVLSEGAPPTGFKRPDGLLNIHPVRSTGCYVDLFGHGELVNDVGLLEILVTYSVFSGIVGLAAANRGRSGIGWFFLALLLSPVLALIAVLVMAPGAAKAVQQPVIYAPPTGPVPPTKALPPAEARKPCPDCGEQVPALARICRFCRYEFKDGPSPNVPDGLPNSTWEPLGSWRVVRLDDLELDVDVGQEVVLALGSTQLGLLTGADPLIWIPYREVVVEDDGGGRFKLSGPDGAVMTLDWLNGPNVDGLRSELEKRR